MGKKKNPDDRAADNGFNQSALANNNGLSEKLTLAGAPIRREEKYRRRADIRRGGEFLG